MKIEFPVAVCFILALVSCRMSECLPVEPLPTGSDLCYTSLAPVWDEAVPLGNAVLGELIWQRGDSLHFSLDHTDLWDLRPTVSGEEQPRHYETAPGDVIVWNR